MGKDYHDHSWDPEDEIEFIRGLTKEIPSDDEVPDLNSSFKHRVFVSPQRPRTRAERLDALRKYLEVLPARSFPGWSEREKRSLIEAATAIYTNAVGQAPGAR
jgi:hypothetical protein